MSKKKSRSPPSDKADKMLNEASKRLHKEWKRQMPQPMDYPDPKWQKGYWGSKRWAEELPKRTWYVQTKQADQHTHSIGFSVTFAAIVLIVTKMLFF